MFDKSFKISQQIVIVEKVVEGPCNEVIISPERIIYDNGDYELQQEIVVGASEEVRGYRCTDDEEEEDDDLTNLEWLNNQNILKSEFPFFF